MATPETPEPDKRAKFGNHMVAPSLLLLVVLSGYVLSVSFIMQSSINSEFADFVERTNNIVDPLNLTLYLTKGYEKRIIEYDSEIIPSVLQHFYIVCIFITILFLFFNKGNMRRQAQHYSEFCAIYGDGASNKKFGVNELKLFWLGLTFFLLFPMFIYGEGTMAYLIGIRAHLYYSHFIGEGLAFTGMFFFFTNYLSARKCSIEIRRTPSSRLG